MIVMAIDHANLLIALEYPSGEFWSRPLPQYDSALAFFTRFVTHLAAPGFFFLMGTGMILFAASRQRAGWTHGSIVRHFVMRGLLLIVLQFLVLNPLGPLRFGGSGRPLLSPDFGILSGLGATILIGALLLRCRLAVLATLSLAAVLSTELWLPGASKADVAFSPLSRLLLIAGRAGDVSVSYPVLPWLGVLGFGMVFGHGLLHDRQQTSRRALQLGVALLLLFVVLRALGGFGNIRAPEGPGWMAFLNVTKYPPSLTFLLLMLGINLSLLGIFSRASRAITGWARPAVVFGQSALFFYVVHLYLYAIIGLVCAPAGTGIPLMYPIWLAAFAILYPLCRWYGTFKHRQPLTSLWRLF